MKEEQEEEEDGALLDVVDSSALSLTELAALLGPGEGPALLHIQTVPALNIRSNTKRAER